MSLYLKFLLFGNQQFLNGLFSSQTMGTYFSHKHVICLVSSGHSEQIVLLFKVNYISQKFPQTQVYFHTAFSSFKFKPFAIASILVTDYTYIKECSNNNIFTVLSNSEFYSQCFECLWQITF